MVANDERAFSSGGSLFDPRTGEVITVKMHMDMGRIRTIIEQEFPPIPMILVNGRVTRIGRIALDRIMKEIEKEL